jgi:hypothetical protein
MTIINPFLNFYISNDPNININDIIDQQYNITTIISTSPEFSNKIYDINEYNITIHNFNTDDNNNIDFSKINQVIYQSISNNGAVLIYEQNINISFAILVSFYIANIECSFFQVTYSIAKLMNINIDNIDNSCLEQMFNFYEQNKKIISL